MPGADGKALQGLASMAVFPARAKDSWYRSVYIDHIKAMTGFETRSAPRDILGNILTRLHIIGRPSLLRPPRQSLFTSAIDAAIREYVEDEGTVTEGELGEDSE
ncbi:hypothetical protein B0H14DRAFT_3435955 [Mycena olivaceomarginata]|nr:hypothetical protein B0H14DRAFT_3435955 [Mycena olivaceomarginata]